MARKPSQKNPKSRERLIQIIQEQGLTQADFASRAYTSSSTITQIKTGKIGLSRDTAEAIIQAFPDYRIEWLLGFDDIKTHTEYDAYESLSLHLAFENYEKRQQIIRNRQLRRDKEKLKAVVALGKAAGYDIKYHDGDCISFYCLFPDAIEKDLTEHIKVFMDEQETMDFVSEIFEFVKWRYEWASRFAYRQYLDKMSFSYSGYDLIKDEKISQGGRNHGPKEQ